MEKIISKFAIDGNLREIKRLKMGHINDTFLGRWDCGGADQLFVHQLINPAVFPDIQGLMDNYVRITSHIQSKLENEFKGNGDRTLEVVGCRDGSFCWPDENGGYWRTYRYVDKVNSYSVCQSSQHAYEAAKACGRFELYLKDLSPDDFHETIPLFHHTPNRYRLFREAIEKDPCSRCQAVKTEIDFVFGREELGRIVLDALEEGSVPLRVTHNDLKFNNVLFDNKTDKAVCVIDLDTCMPGSLLYDFGDLVRNTGVGAEEDETDLSKVYMDEEYFSALARGYLEIVRDYCTDEEIRLMAFAPRLLTLNIGMRFLTDYINGDVYFRINYEQQNLDRARNQFKIIESMEEQEAKMIEIVDRYR
jgi:hypothetical protein